jgi:hypothetical protein
VFPELEITEVISRMRPSCESHLKAYENSNKRVLHLVATHAAVVKCMSVIYGGEFQHGICWYCALSGIEIDGKNWRLIFAEDDSHIASARL